MNTATKITVARIVLIPIVVAVYLINFPYNNVATCVLFALVCATDFIDGHIARSRNQVTDLGKFLDPIADKVIVVVMLFLIAEKNILPVPVGSIICGLIISREFIISGFRMIASEKKVVISADVWGKVKTILFDVGISALVLDNGGALSFNFFYWLGSVTLYLGTVISIFSCINYIIKNKQVIKNKPVTVKLNDVSNPDNAENTDK